MAGTPARTGIKILLLNKNIFYFIISPCSYAYWAYNIQDKRSTCHRCAAMMFFPLFPAPDRVLENEHFGFNPRSSEYLNKDIIFISYF